MNIFVMSFFTRHIEVYNLVLISIIDIEGGLDMEFAAFFVFNNATESGGDGIEKGGLANARVTD